MSIPKLLRIPGKARQRKRNEMQKQEEIQISRSFDAKSLASASKKSLFSKVNKKVCQHSLSSIYHILCVLFLHLIILPISSICMVTNLVNKSVNCHQMLRFCLLALLVYYCLYYFGGELCFEMAFFSVEISWEEGHISYTFWVISMIRSPLQKIPFKKNFLENWHHLP